LLRSCDIAGYRAAWFAPDSQRHDAAVATVAIIAHGRPEIARRSASFGRPTHGTAIASY